MPIVNGIDAFRAAMAGHEGEYVLIGGGACSVLFDAEGETFRATKDLDIVILTDAGASGFARSLWDFIKDNGYVCWKRAETNCSYYRFELPEGSSGAMRLPAQIELFARHPDFVLENEESEVAPLPFDEDVSSLSAIILDDGYYEFIRGHVSLIDGIPLLRAIHIIPLKMRAHIDLNRKHVAGRHVNEKDLVKHRGDVARLSRLLTLVDRLPLEGRMRDDAEEFLADFERYAQRQTSGKQRLVLMDDLTVLRTVYLGG